MLIWINPEADLFKCAAVWLLFLISQTLQGRQMIQAGHPWRSQVKWINNLPLWNPTHRITRACRKEKTFKHQVDFGRGCSHGDQSGAMNERGRERERESKDPWYQHDLIYIYIYIYKIIFSLVQWKKTVNTLKLIGLQKNLLQEVNSSTIYFLKTT